MGAMFTQFHEKGVTKQAGNRLSLRAPASIADCNGKTLVKRQTHDGKS